MRTKKCVIDFCIYMWRAITEGTLEDIFFWNKHSERHALWFQETCEQILGHGNQAPKYAKPISPVEALYWINTLGPSLLNSWSASGSLVDSGHCSLADSSGPGVHNQVFRYTLLLLHDTHCYDVRERREKRNTIDNLSIVHN